ncbi:MAG TPA: AraC family transcriptional regulator [Opitutus sp.]|nr:AraC family transcriptional regulator [Opitutus sp.]
MVRAETILWSQPPDMPEIESISVHNGRRLWCVFHQTYTVCTILRHAGASDWLYRRRRHLVGDRQLMLMEPGEVHRNIRHFGDADFHVVMIQPALVGELAREAGLRATPHLALAQTGAPAVFDAFRRLHAMLAQGGSILERQSLLAAAVRQLLADCAEERPHPDPAPDRAGLRRARDYLHECCAEKVALADLARMAGLSRFHFLRAFAQQFGLPPHAYQIGLRLEKARLLLKAGRPIAEVDAGFADQSHLTRRFKARFGVTPGEYAAMVRRRPFSAATPQ